MLWLSETLKEANMSAYGVAKIAGTSQQTVSRIARGQRGVSPEMVTHIAHAIALRVHPHDTQAQLTLINRARDEAGFSEIDLIPPFPPKSDTWKSSTRKNRALVPSADENSTEDPTSKALEGIKLLTKKIEKDLKRLKRPRSPRSRPDVEQALSLEYVEGPARGDQRGGARMTLARAELEHCEWFIIHSEEMAPMAHAGTHIRIHWTDEAKNEDVIIYHAESGSIGCVQLIGDTEGQASLLDLDGDPLLDEIGPYTIVGVVIGVEDTPQEVLRRLRLS